jgi:hypothetical protein
MEKLCKCGCGSYTKGYNDYIHGHNRRGLVSHTYGKKWSIKYDKCLLCGTIEIRHYGRGLCIKCWKAKRWENKKSGVGKWAEKHDSCIKCGRIDRPHKAKGLCGTCYINNLNRKKGKPERNFGAWSWYYDKCQKCGTTKRQHAAKGLCIDCYRQSDGVKKSECPICMAKVINLNQHLAMRSRKCKDHKKYQYDRFKMYFDSDLNLSDIGKELNMDRHSITRQFIKFFGKEKTKERNEMIRRCNISEKAVINHNYKNMYGTIVEHDSPNQGRIKLRSKLELKYAKKLNKQKLDWYYERDSFQYIDINGRMRTYTPDFYITEYDKYIEVKGKNLLDDGDLYKTNWVRKNASINIEIVELK